VALRGVFFDLGDTLVDLGEGRGSYEQRLALRTGHVYDALLPYNQNDQIEIRQAEPYSYCQFVYGAEHPGHGRARHPWLTGSAGWNYTAVTKWVLGVRVGFEGLVVDPCVPKDWKEFEVQRKWRGATYKIRFQNPKGVSKGVQSVTVNGEAVSGNVIPRKAEGSVNEVVVTLG